MTIKNFFRIILLSFHSPQLYIDVLSKWKHWGLAFLLRFSILVTLVSSVALFSFISLIDFNSPSMHSLLSNIPEIKVVNGKGEFIDSNINSPLEIKSSDGSKTLIAIDLNKQSSEANTSDIPVLFTSNMISINFLNAAPLNLNYQDLFNDSKDNIINSELLINFLNAQQKNILGMILFLGVPLGSLVYFFLTLLKTGFYSSIAHIISTIFKLNLTFQQLTRVAIVANVPAVIISTVYVLIFFDSPLLQLDQYLIGLVHLFYFVGGIFSYIKERPQL